MICDATIVCVCSLQLQKTLPKSWGSQNDILMELFFQLRLQKSRGSQILLRTVSESLLLSHHLCSRFSLKGSFIPAHYINSTILRMLRSKLMTQINYSPTRDRFLKKLLANEKSHPQTRSISLRVPITFVEAHVGTECVHEPAWPICSKAPSEVHTPNINKI